MKKVSLFSILLSLFALLTTIGCGEEENGKKTYTIMATAGQGGTISPSGEVTVAEGGDRTFTITSDAGWGIKDVEVDDVSIGPHTSYVFENVRSNHTILATFQQGLSLTVTVEGNGTVIKDPDKAVYDEGDSVELTALADDGWSFVGWQGDVSDSVNPVTVVMDGSKAVTAVFAEGQQHILEVVIQGQGSVVKDPDQAAYADGTVVTLTATPEDDWVFDRWEGDATGSDNPVQVTMNGDKSVTAYFGPSTTMLAVYVDGGGEVVVDQDKPSYDYGEEVVLTATADAGWVFDRWDGDATGSDNPLTISMTGNKVITAYFIQETFTLNVIIDGAGSVTKDPDQSEYNYGALVTLTAVPDTGMEFDHWEGAVTSTANPVQLVIDGEKEVTAFFVVGEYVVETAVVGSGGVTRDPDQATYAYGDEVTLSAVPDSGWEFDHWEGDLTGSTNPALVTVQGDVSVIAHFNQVAYTLTVTVDGDGSVVKDPDQANYLPGAVVDLTAIPGSGSVFNGWEGDLTGGANPAQITMDSDKAVTAYFIVPSILLVDDDNGDSFQNRFVTALNANGLVHTVSTVASSSSNGPDLSTMQAYDLVIWMTGNAYTPDPLTATDETNLMAYLDGGGRLFLAGQDLIRDSPSALSTFFTDYIHITSYVRDAGANSIVATDDEISAGLGTITPDYSGITDYTDTLTPDSLATVSFTKSSSGPAVSVKAIDGNFRTVYIGFPFAAVAQEDAAIAAILMNRIVTWLLQ